MQKKLLLTAILAAIAGLILAQGISFTAQAPRQVNTGQRFYLNYTLNTEGSGFIGPEISSFEILSGPSIQNSSQVQIVNGKISQQVFQSFVFILQATNPGTYSIGPATVTAGGKKYSSNSVTITVTGPKTNGTQQGTQSQQQQNNSGKNSVVSDPGKDIFLKAVVNKSNPFIGEQVVLTLKLYTPTSQIRLGAPVMNTYEGFWSKDLLTNQKQWTQYTENFNGKKYLVVEVGKVALFPQKSGVLNINAIEQDLQYQIRVKGKNPFGDDPFFNDPFFKDFFDNSAFGDNYQTVEKSLKSNSIAINVKPLPASGKPIDFSGAVGSFNLMTDLAPSGAKTNEALTFKVTVSGSGNLNLIENPAINFPPDFEVYDPRIIDNIHSGSSGISGSRTFEYLIIPRTVGKFKISPVTFSYFDPSKNSYVNLSSEIAEIDVAKGSGTTEDAITGRDIQQINKDIRFIREKSGSFRSKGYYFYGSALYRISLAIPLLLFIAFIIIRRKHVKSRADVVGLRQRKATRLATSRLKRASNLLKQQNEEAFYEEISAALWGYAANKFNIPLAELSTDTARHKLEERKVDPVLIEHYLEVLQQCEFARFAPGSKSDNMQHVYDNAFKAITETESQLK